MPGTGLLAAYSIADLEVFRALDAFGLLMIEQPLHHTDLVRHAELQRAIATDLCLDESIRSSADAAAAIELGSCRIVMQPRVIAVSPRPMRPFQGWRYLSADSAPPDLTRSAASGVAAMPEPMRRELRDLGLL